MEEDTATSVIHRYAKHLVGAVSVANAHSLDFLVAPNPFNIPNTFEARSGIGPVQNRIRSQRIAIIGLGGTGSYVLDLIAKTPVAEIHLLDSDELAWHNFMRSPGAPTADEIEKQRKKAISKNTYYLRKYESLRRGIFNHAIRVESASDLSTLISSNPVDFAFVCIDQRTESESPRQDFVYSALSQSDIPFVDSGISIGIEESAIRGVITTSYHPPGSHEWQFLIPNAKVVGDRPGYRNVQLPDINSLAASLAVTEWRRRTGQYVTDSTPRLHKFRLECPRIVHV